MFAEIYLSRFSFQFPCVWVCCCSGEQHVRISRPMFPARPAPAGEEGRQRQTTRLLTCSVGKYLLNINNRNLPGLRKPSTESWPRAPGLPSRPRRALPRPRQEGSGASTPSHVYSSGFTGASPAAAGRFCGKCAPSKSRARVPLGRGLRAAGTISKFSGGRGPGDAGLSRPRRRVRVSRRPPRHACAAATAGHSQACPRPDASHGLLGGEQ